MMMVSAGLERKEKKERMNERNLMYLGFCYFGAIFELKLSCQLGIGSAKVGFCSPSTLKLNSC